MKSMSCRKHGHHDDNCVCGVLRAIADVQDQVDPDVDNNDCEVSCERSIEELLSPITPPAPVNNTIPVILYCDCSPFLGFGVKKVGNTFTCFQSFVFKVKSVDEDCCAVLELLSTNKSTGGGAYPPSPVLDDPCDQFPATAFEGTGICITVDLSCFCAVTCLEPTFV
jgi:hypothetical protein